MDSFAYILIMLGAVLVSNLISQRFHTISTPLVQITLGILIAVLPLFHLDLTFDPELFMVLFIAPLLFEDAKNLDKSTLWRLKKPILLLALGLVFATCLAVGGIISFFIPVIPLAACFALAAALAPTDAVAVTSLEETSTIDSENHALLRGESLFNDASSIVCFQFALAALAVGPFAASSGSGQAAFVGDIVTTFIFMFIGGVIVGAGLMFLRYVLVRILRAAGVEAITFHVLFELVTPLLVFLIAEAFEVSGIIAVVVAGIMYGFAPRRQSPSAAQHSLVSTSVWGVATFTLNGIVFLILGTQLPNLIRRVWVYSNADHVLLVISIVVILLAIMIIRFVWVFLMHRSKPLVLQKNGIWDEYGNLRHTEDDTLSEPDVSAQIDVEGHNNPPESKNAVFRESPALSIKERREQRRQEKEAARQRQHECTAAERRQQGYLKTHLKDALVLTLTGVKGAITLALLLTIPLTLSTGELFPARDLLLFLASGTIILSLLVANFVVPFIAPKIHEPLAPESEINAIHEIFRMVVLRLSEQTTPENKLQTETAIRQYYNRLSTLKTSNQASDPVEDELRKQIITWECDFTLELVDKGRVSAAIGSLYIYQLSRILAHLEHHGETRWVIVNIFKQFSHEFGEARRYRKEHAAEFSSQSGLGRKRSKLALKELQEENYRYVVDKLSAMLTEPDAPAHTISFIKGDFERRLARLAATGRRRSFRERGFTFSSQNTDFEEILLEVNLRALQYEREAIEQMFSQGRITRETAQRLRDNVSIMDLDLKQQLD